MEKPKIQLSVVSQAKVLESRKVDAITAPTSGGEITVLPGHIPLFARLQAGELRFQDGSESESFVVSRGFIDVGLDNHVTVIVDSVVAAREISIQKAEAAIAAAQATMSQSEDQQELLMAEASLKLALLEIKVARKTRHAGN